MLFTAGIGGNSAATREGAESSKIYMVGNILMDTLRFNHQRFARPAVMDKLGLTEKRYIVFTLNRKAIIGNDDELRAELSKIFVENKEYKNLYISVLSFGFKYGIPADADLVFDVRFLPNPYYIDELRPKSGNDKEVREYVMDNDKARTFLAKLTDMVEFLIPNYVQEGKTQLVIGIGCTGGKHRSVTLANELYEALSKNDNYGIRIEHRDIGKDAVTKAR